MKRPGYTLMDELLASPTQPLPQEWRTHQLTRMWGALAALESSPSPTADDWRVCSDAVNLCETLVTRGPWIACDGSFVEARDTSCLLGEATEAMAAAAKRHTQGKPLRLSGAGIQAVRAVLEDYAGAIDVLSARAMVRCHRMTERRIAEILAGKRQPHDVEVVDL